MPPSASSPSPPTPPRRLRSAPADLPSRVLTPARHRRLHANASPAKLRGILAEIVFVHDDAEYLRRLATDAGGLAGLWRDLWPAAAAGAPGGGEAGDCAWLHACCAHDAHRCLRWIFRALGRERRRAGGACAPRALSESESAGLSRRDPAAPLLRPWLAGPSAVAGGGDGRFRACHLGAVEEADFYRLVQLAEEEKFEEGDLVLHQGEANPKIRLILEGELEVLRDGTLTYVLEKGNFASEAGLHSGLLLGGSVEACGTLVVGPPFDPAGRHNARRAVKNRVRCLAWDRDALTALLRRDRALRAALQAALSWDVVRKLKMQRDLITAGRVRDAAAWTRKREEQGASRYASIVQNLLRGRAGTAAGGARAAEEAALLATYRVIHRIGDGEHAGALARCGWTAEEFRAGRAAAGVEDEAEEEAFVGARWRGVVRRCTTTVQSLLE